MSAQHTPGIWFAQAPDPEAAMYNSQHHWSIRYRTTDGSAMLGAQIARITSLNTGHEEANARLMANAPVMLDALRRAVLALAFAAETSPAMRDDYEAVSLAIAKATGAAP